MTTPFDAALAFRQSSLASIVVACDAPRWTILEVNDAYLEATGMSRDRLVGQPMFTVFPESTATAAESGAAQIRHSFESMCGDGTAVSLPPLRYDIPTEDGAFEERVWGLTNRPIRNAAGEMVAILHEICDETERVRTTRERDHLVTELHDRTADAERATTKAQAAEAQLTDAFEQAPIAIAMTLGPDHRFIVANHRYTEMVGHPDPVGELFIEALPEVAAQGYLDILDRVYHTGEPHVAASAPARLPETGDTERWFDFVYQPVRHGNRGVTGVMQVALEVTDQVRARHLTEEREREIRTLADAIPTLAWTARSDGYIDWYNARWYEYTGTTPAEMEGWGWQRVHDPRTLEQVVESWSHSIQTGTPFEMTFPLRSARGRYRRFLTRATPVRGPEGEILRWFGTNTDVEAEYRARRQAEEAVSRTSRLQELTGALAGAATVEAIAERVVAEAMSTPGVLTAVFVTREPSGTDVTLVRYGQVRPGVLEDHQVFPMSLSTPVTDCLSSGTPLYLESASELEARYPDLVPLLRDLGARSSASIPLTVGGQVVAAMSFLLSAERHFSETDRLFLDTLATQTAQALERLALMEAEQRTRQRIQTVVEAVTDGFVAVDADMRFTYVNGRAAEMWEIPADRLVGHSPLDIWPDQAQSPALFISMVQRALATRSPQNDEGYSPSLHRWVELRTYPAEDGGIVVFFTDISERRRSQEAADFLAEASRVLGSAADYEATLKTLAEACVPTLGDWCAVDILSDPASTAWPPVLDRVAVVHQDPAKVALGLDLTERYPTDWEAPTGLPDVIRQGRPFFFPTVTDELIDATAQDDEHRRLLRALHFRSVMILPLTARGRVLGALTLCMTESDRHYTEADLALATDLAARAGIAVDNARLLRDAAAANTTKTEFLRTISHELRQPLNATMSFLQLWEMGLRGPLTPEMTEDLGRVQRNQQHLMTLIEDLLSFTRIEAGRLEVERTCVAIDPVLETLEPMIKPQMSEKGIAFTNAHCPTGLEVMGDHDRIVQVVLNLLTNALRATASGGSVTLGCQGTDETVEISVRDTGVGIPEDKLEAIFSPFTQLGRALNRPKEGAGLGLAISRGLATAMGGSLTAESVVGEGSTFTLHLPRAPR